MKTTRRLTMIITVFSLFLFLLSGEAQATNCDDVITNLTSGLSSVPNASCQTPANQIYRVNLSAITFNSNNMIFDCNGSTLQGNFTDGSTAITASKSNVSVRNCKINGYEFGIYTFGTGINNVTFDGNTVTNVTRGYTLRGVSNSFVINNRYSQNGSLDATPSGIDLYGDGSSNQVYNNIIDSGKYGIRVFGNNQYNSIHDNTFTNQMVSTGNNIYIYQNASNSVVYSNIVTNSSRNGIGAHANNTIVYSNFVSGYSHHGLDTFRDSSVGGHVPSNITYYNNVIFNSATTDSGSAGIYLLNGSNVVYRNNTIVNVYNAGISIEGDNTVKDVMVDSNSISGVADTCINFYGGNVTFLNNSLATCNTQIKLFYATQYGTLFADTYFRNNVYAGNYLNYLFYNQQVNLTVNDSNSQKEIINLSQINSLITLDYIGAKDYKVVNNSITFNPTGFNFSCYWLSNNSIYGNNFASATIGVSSSSSLVCSKSSASGGCDYPYEDFIINATTTLCSGVYNLNDSIGNGAIFIGASGINLTCSGTLLNGNMGLGIGLNLSDKSNIIVQNCSFNNYRRALFTKGTFQTYDSANITVRYNQFNNSQSGVYFQGSDYSNVYENTFYGCNLTYNSGAINTYGSCTSNKIYNNFIQGNGTCAFGVNIDTNSKNTSITNNRIYNVDRGIMAANSDNMYIMNNYIENATYNNDFYMVGIMVFSSPAYSTVNVTVSNNTVVNAGSVGIQVQGDVINISIINNNLDLVSWSEKASQKYRYGGTTQYDILDGGDTACGIVVGSVFKSFVSDSTESSSDSYSKIHNYTASNVRISGNTFSTDIDCLLWQHGNETQLSSFSNDLTNYWYKKFRMPVEFIDMFEFYVSNNANNLQRYCPNCLGDKTVTTNLYFGYQTNGVYANRKYNYSISKTTQVFKNVNQTTSYNLTLNNLTVNPQGLSCVGVFYSNQSLPVWSGCGATYDTFGLTMSPNNRTITVQYPDSNMYILSADKTITSISYIKTATSLKIRLSGSGSATVSYLGFLLTKNDEYFIYKDGTYIGLNSAQTYVITDGTEWEFRTTGLTYTQTAKRNTFLSEENLSLFSIIILIIIVTLLIYAAIEVKKGNSDQFRNILMTIFVLIFFIIILDMILTVLLR